MSDQGYVYILINPSMKGIINVGGTRRDPDEWASELSASTGVPTPFFVGYQAEVNNYTHAEAFVHKLLDAYRVNDNREFFNTSITEAINAIMEYIKIDDQYNENNYQSKAGCLDAQTSAYEVEEKIADDYYNGTNGQFQDYEEAMKHYKKAVALGSGSACQSIGLMYRLGEGVHTDLREALRWYKEGLRRKAYGTYYHMLQVYLALEEFENANKCMQKIFFEDDLFYMSMGTVSYLKACQWKNIDNNFIGLELIQRHIPRIKDYLETQARSNDKYKDMYIEMVRDLDSACDYYHIQQTGSDNQEQLNMQKALLNAYKSGHYKRCPTCKKICFENAVVCPVCENKLI